jgi:hypothetical protein
MNDRHCRSIYQKYSIIEEKEKKKTAGRVVVRQRPF